jgi:hypothetical protein
MPLFNGLHLQRGDKDRSDPLDPKKPPRYQGTPRSDLTGETFVVQLQKLLSTLGFGFIKPDDKDNFDGKFGPLTEMAVREFQIYAASKVVAQHDSRSKQQERIFDALKPFLLQDENRYIDVATTGDPFPATGAVNSMTAKLLEFWRDNELRCPVILTAFNVTGNLRDPTRTAQVSPSTSNLWRHDELIGKESKVRVFARDFTTDFRRDSDKPIVTRVEMLEQGATKLIFDSKEISLVDLSDATSAEQIKQFLWPAMVETSNDLEVIGPSGGPWDIRFTGNAESRNQDELGKLSASEPDKLLVTLVPAWEEVGDFVKYKSSGGPRSHPRVHTLKSELMPEACTGENEEKINESADKRSTYRVIRAVSEAECVGYFDSVNAYDPGVISVGPCHWTFALGQSGGIAAAGELAGFVAYYRKKDPEEFRKFFTRFGLDVNHEWGEDGAKLYSSQLRTYSNCWWTRPIEDGSTTPMPQTLAEVNYYRSWHWFYRWVMAGRTMPAYCKAMYDFARIRLRDLLSTPFADETDLPKHSTDQERVTRPATLGEVFSSEAATALLLRWHINQPGRVLRKGLASSRIRQVIEKAGTNCQVTVDQWNDDDQEKLIGSLYDQILESAKHLSSTLPNVATRDVAEKDKGWPAYLGRENLGYSLNPLKPADPPAEPNPLEKLVNKPLLREAKAFSFDREIPNTPGEPSIPTGQGSNVPDVFQIIRAHTGEKGASELKKPNQAFGLALVGQLSDVGQYNVQAIVLTALDKGGQAQVEEDENSGGSPVASLTNPGPDPDRVFGFAIPVVNLDLVDVEIDDEAKDDQDALFIANSGQQSYLPEDGYLSVRSLRNSTALKGKRFELNLAQLFSPLDNNRSLDLEATLVVDDFTQGDSGALNVAAHLDVVLNHSLLPRPFRWSFAISSSSSEASGKLPTWFRFEMADPGNPEEVDGAWLEFRTGADFGEIARNSPLDLGLPVVLNKTTEGEAEISAALRLSIGPDGKLWPVLEATLKGEIGIDLGSPLARLALTPGPNGLKLRYDPEQGLALGLPTSAKANLRLDLFNVFKGTNAVVNNVWSASGDNQKWLVDLEARTLLDESPEPLVIRWTGSYPEVAVSLFEKLFHAVEPPAVSPDRQLQSLSGRVLGADLPTRVTFKRCVEGNKTTFTVVDGTAQLRACMWVSVAGGDKDNVLLEAEGTFVFTMPADGDGLLRFQPGAFSCTAEALVRTGSAMGSRFGNAMVSLHVPQGTAFRIDCNPSNPIISWDPEESRKTTPQPISIRVPGSDETTTDKPEDLRFTFDLEEFRLHSAGIDLRGSARAEGVKLGKSATTGFDGAVSVRSPEKSGGTTERNTERPAAVGEIIFKNSRLIAGSLQASAKLRYFDDAVGTLRINLSESEDESRTLACAGTLDVAGISEFRVAPLFALFRLTAFSLGITYTETDQWKSTARLTGRVEFTPPVGRSASEMGELSDLFGGVAVEFEDLDLLKLGIEQVRFDFPTKRFSFAEILNVELQALTIKNDNEFKLNGDISLSNLPGVDSSLTLSEISLKATGSGPPEFRVGRIGASFDVPGGFRLDGQLEHVDLADESGFVGGFAITTESLPRMSGIVKLTRVRAINGDMVPSMAVFVEAGFDAALFGGFYLRSLGVGIGVYQALRGLEPSNQPLPQKIVALVNNPQGLPQPMQVDSWVPARPQTSRGPLNWMLVGSGLITYSKLERNQPHPFAGSLLLAIDQDLQIIAGVNLWLFTSPDETRDPAFIQRPVGRGALGISVRERRVFAMFRTLSRPKLGKDTPKLLGEVLSRVETTMLFSADPNGLLLEVGWPWETKIGPYRLGPFEGTLTSGFRFGLYRGVTTFGLNYAIAVQLRAQAKWGFDAGFGSARASIGIEGSGLFRASFAGAIDSKFNTYLIGDVRLATTVRLYAAAEASFRIRITRWLRISKTIRFRRNLNLAINAALTAALDSQANVGFRGEAQIAVSICGYRLAGRVAFEHEAGRIEDIRKKINKLLPPSPLAETPRFSQATPKPKEATNWHYRFRRLQLADGTNVIRVLLFPQPGLEYPRPQSSGANPEASPRFNIPLIQSVQDKFRGFVASPRLDNDLSGNLLQWSEALDQTVDQIPYEDETTTKLHDITLADLLGFVETEKNTSNRNCFDSNLQKEVADERAIRPGAATSDDETAGLEQVGGPVSPNLSRTASAYDTALTDAWQSKKEPAPVVNSIPLADLSEFEKLETLTSNRPEEQITIQPNSADQQVVAIHTLISNLLKTSPVAAEAASATFEVAEVRLDCTAEETAKTDALTASYRTLWQLDGIVLNGDARIWRISLDDGGRQGHILRRREGTVVEVTDIQEVRAISSGLILAELLELLGDDRLSGGIDFQSAAASTSVSGELDDPYRIAPYMRLVLEFEEFADGEPGRLAADPVPHLIQLEDNGAPEPMTLGGATRHLMSVLGPTGRLLAPPEYDFFPGPVYQSAQQIGLTWRFLREDEIDIGRAGGEGGSGEDPFLPYQELEKFIVTRTNLSRPADPPRVVEILPVWLVAGVDEDEGKEQLVKPQLQFVDDDIQGVRENDLLLYRVEARATDRPLASFLLNVVRQTLTPLESVGQALALHWIDAKPPHRQGQVEIVLAAEQPDFEPNQLRILYRRVPATTIGAYGFETRPPVDTRLVPGVPSRATDKSFPDVQFAESESTRTIPWADVLDLEDVMKQRGQSSPSWEPVKLRRRDPRTGEFPDDTVTTGYRAVLAEENLRLALGEVAGEAIELYIGREDREDKDPRTNRPLRRSPLTRCRHAVTPLTKRNSPDTVRGERVFEASRGNPVDALEWLPAMTRGPEFLSKTAIRAVAEYEDPAPPSEQKEKAQPPRVAVEWAHDTSDRGSALEADDSAFDPVIGYRIHRLDRHDPALLTGAVPTDNSDFPALERVVSVVPEAYYRSQPESVAVMGLRTFGEVPDQMDKGSAAGLDELVTRLTDNPVERSTPDWVAMRTPPDWFKEKFREIIDPAVASVVGAFEQYPFDSHVGPVWLHKALSSGVKQLRIQLVQNLKANPDDVKFDLRFSRPLPYWSRIAPEEGNPTAQDRLETLRKELNTEVDPYGWLTAEALGRSCECRFRTRNDDRPMRAEQVLDAFAAVVDSDVVLGQDSSGTEVKAKLGAFLQVVIFTGDDARTPLDMLRLVVRQPLTQEDPSVWLGLARQLRLVDHNATKAGEDLDAIPEPVANFCAEITARLKLLTEAPAVVLRRESRGANAADANPADRANGTITLPIDAQGRVRLHLPVPDTWAHCYRIAIQPIRRYGQIRAMLAIALRSESSTDEVSTPEPIRADYWVEVLIDRTRELVAHNILATPLPGSIQALVFRHPAAFASTANAAAKAYGQYSSQGVAFERRIPPALKEILQSVILNLKQSVGETFSWDAYRAWLMANNFDHGSDPPTDDPEGPFFVARGNEPLKDPLILTPVVGTEVGVYGADRYVAPDLPGYYEYRAMAWSTAGRVTSLPISTGWVAPLYDEKRQRPATVPARARYKSDKLTVELLLIHPLFHMREDLRKLWVGADHRVRVEGVDVKELPLGHLPDLALSYQVFIWQNFNPNDDQAARVYIPLARVLPPSPGQPWFRSESQTPGLTVTSSNGFTPTIQPMDDDDQKGNGGLWFQLRFERSETASAASDELFAMLREAAEKLSEDDFATLFSITVERNGVRSELVPLPP